MGFLLNTMSTVMCPHGGKVVLTTTNTTVLVNGAPALLMTDVHTVAGCQAAAHRDGVAAELDRGSVATSQSLHSLTLA